MNLGLKKCIMKKIVEDIGISRERDWGFGNNPKTAVNKFLNKNERFIVDYDVEKKLLLTCHPGGYLKAIK
jgi:cephalosporin hydroxylase